MPPPEADAPPPRTPDDLPGRRREIGRGLGRSHYAAVVASGLVGLLALAALWLSVEARQRAEEARRASALFWEFGSRASGLERLSRRVGQRQEALKIVREAAQFQPSRELRDEALSALLLPDLGTNLVWQEQAGWEFAGTYDADLKHFILNNNRGRAIVRRVADGATLMDEAGFRPYTHHCQFSPDGRLAAIAFTDREKGEVGVWDWLRTNLVARFPSIDSGWLQPPFDFAPDGMSLWLLTTDRLLACYDLRSKEPTSVLIPEHPARSVRLSQSGKFAALACDKVLDVWELSSRKLRASLTLTNDIWRLAWQPGGERLAIGCGGGLWLWDLAASNAVGLAQSEHLGITDLCFDRDGDLLIVGGFFELGEIWDLRHMRRVLEPGMGHLVQLSRDETRLATYRERVGFGIREFLPPVGVRNWPAPPSLGPARWGADLDPAERWLLTAHLRGWLLRDADSGQELARAPCDLVGTVSFSADGSNVLAWTSEGLARWPLRPSPDGSARVGPKRIFEFGMTEGFNVTCFSADRRFTAHAFQGVMTVANTDDPSQRVRIPLRRPRDNSIHLSNDGRWLITAYNNQVGWDLYATRSGQFVRTLATNELSGASFDPVTGQLFTSSATGWESWQLPEGTVVKRAAWRESVLGVGFIAFAPNGRLALANSPPSAFTLYDLETRRDFATLDFRDPLDVHTCHWSHNGQRLFLCGNDGGVRRVDLQALRAELDRLGLHSLNWSDDAPSREFPAAGKSGEAANSETGATHRGESPHSAWRNPPKLAWWVAAGLVTTIAIGHYILRYQRRLFAGYLETESLAEQRAEQLRGTHAALAHSEKMKALGTMAAGVAHDFNNLLSVIRLSSELIEEKTQADAMTKGNFDAIQQAVQRGRGIVNSMLGYARDDGQVRAFAPGGLLSDAVALLSKPFLSGLVLEIEVDPATPEVLGRRGRVEQMLLNLVVNAAEAMAGRGTLRLSVREVSEAVGCVLPPRSAGSYVELRVADSGPGIPTDVLPRIFEPFFTTKNKGAQRGTGLGLSMLYTMAKEDGVGVAVETAPGRGTTFRLFLPFDAAISAERGAGLADAAIPPAAEQSAAAAPRPPQAPDAGREPPTPGPPDIAHPQS